MVRLSGRCPRGERLVCRVPHGHWKTITFVAALRRNGMTAPFVVDGAMSGKTFLAYVKRCLAPALKRRDIVVMDRLPRIRFLAYAKRSKHEARDFAICPNTHRI
jgi:hypothetical protein